MTISHWCWSHHAYVERQLIRQTIISGGEHAKLYSYVIEHNSERWQMLLIENYLGYTLQKVSISSGNQKWQEETAAADHRTTQFQQSQHFMRKSTWTYLESVDSATAIQASLDLFIRIYNRFDYTEQLGEVIEWAVRILNNLSCDFIVWGVEYFTSK